MKIACPSCHAQFEVAPEHAGKVAPCPRCGAQMQIPFPPAQIVDRSPAPAPAPAPELDVPKIAKGVALGIIIVILIVIMAVVLLGGYGASRTADDIRQATEGLR